MRGQWPRLRRGRSLRGTLFRDTPVQVSPCRDRPPGKAASTRREEGSVTPDSKTSEDVGGAESQFCHENVPVLRPLLGPLASPLDEELESLHMVSLGTCGTSLAGSWPPRSPPVPLLLPETGSLGTPPRGRLLSQQVRVGLGSWEPVVVCQAVPTSLSHRP